MTAEIPTVFLIDDDPSARRGLSRLVQTAGMIVKAYDSAGEFLNRDHTDVHGCIVLDLQMPKLSGLDLQEELLKAGNTIPIIFLSAHSDVPDTALAMKKGAVDFLTKPVDSAHLLKAITESLERDLANRKLRSQQAMIRKRVSSLTPREHTVLEYVISGMLNKQIAYELGITEDTVKIHRGRIMKKMTAGSLVGLVRLAELAGIKPAQTSEPRT